MPYLLHTNIAIHFRDRDRLITERVIAMEESPSLSLLSLVELETGVQREPALTFSRRRLLDAMLHQFLIIDFDRSVVLAYGRIVAALGYSRRKVIDRLIAATAIAYDRTLVTINVDDFRDVPGLRLELWPAQ